MCSESSGVQLKIENNSFSIDSHNGYEISSGFKTKIAIERIFKANLPKPYSNCDLVDEEEPHLANTELYDLIHRSKYNYEQQLCISRKQKKISFYLEYLQRFWHDPRTRRIPLRSKSFRDRLKLLEKILKKGVASLVKK